VLELVPAALGYHRDISALIDAATARLPVDDDR
jgi:hypothetical protein